MNLLITGAFKYSASQRESFEALGLNIIDMPMEKDCLPVSPNEIDIVICNGLFLNHDIKEFTNLKCIQLTSAGFDRVPLDYINEHGIKIFNARGVYSIPMAEWVVMRILENYKSLTDFNNQQKENQWIKIRSLKELSGIKVAIIGSGNVGREIAKRLSAFDCDITGFDVHENSLTDFDRVKIISKFKDEVSAYDIIILTAPLTDDTRHMLNRTILEDMKNEAMLINVSRGALIDELALVDVLKHRKDITAALDVFEHEPLPNDSPLWKMKNILISPHNSFVGNNNNKRLFAVILNNINSFMMNAY